MHSNPYTCLSELLSFCSRDKKFFDEPWMSKVKADASANWRLKVCLESLVLFCHWCIISGGLVHVV